jgi:hypothetical protein
VAFLAWYWEHLSFFPDGRGTTYEPSLNFFLWVIEAFWTVKWAGDLANPEITMPWTPMLRGTTLSSSSYAKASR